MASEKNPPSYPFFFVDPPYLLRPDGAPDPKLPSWGDLLECVRKSQTHSPPDWDTVLALFNMPEAKALLRLRQPFPPPGARGGLLRPHLQRLMGLSVPTTPEETRDE